MTPEELADLRPLLPQTALELIRVAGLEAAAQLVAAWPGQEFPVPVHSNANQKGARRFDQLAEIVGEPAALRIVAHWGGQRLDIPNCKEAKWARTQDRIRAHFDRLTAKGYSYTDAVFELGITYNVTSRCVDGVLKRPDSAAQTAVNDAQLALF